MNIRTRFQLGDIGASSNITKQCGTDWERLNLTVNIPSDVSYLGLIFYGNAVAGTMYIKDIMISYADVEDVAYEEYYPTNKELYEQIESLKEQIESV